MTLMINDNKYVLMAIITDRIGYVHTRLNEAACMRISYHVEKCKTHARSARLFMHTHIVTQFSVAAQYISEKSDRVTHEGEHSFERCSFEIGLVFPMHLCSLREFIKLARRDR